MQRVDGTAIARKLLRDPPYEKARTMIAGQLGEILARIHAVDLADLPPLVHREAADHIAGMRRALDALEPAAAGLRAGAVLARPAHGRRRSPSRCWCMATTAPATISPTRAGVTAILDWEGAHLGDPVEDLGWLCVKSWRFGAVDKPAGGFGSREELWAAYERAGGAKVDPARAHWWEVFGTVRWGIICHQQAWRHLSGAVKSMELASIGRRAVETEVDLLQLLKEKA